MAEPQRRARSGRIEATATHRSASNPISRYAGQSASARDCDELAGRRTAQPQPHRSNADRRAYAGVHHQLRALTPGNPPARPGEDIVMTQNNAVTQNAVGFVPCLQCAPAESSPDGPAQCRPEVCPRYGTMDPGPPAQTRRPATKRKPTPFLPAAWAVTAIAGHTGSGRCRPSHASTATTTGSSDQRRAAAGA